MKIKITIIGPRVHDVGYRYFLMTNAIDMGLKGFQARNRVHGTDLEVVALIEGNEEAIEDFKDLVESKKPEHAEVSNITFENCDSDVMKTESYAQICSAIQLNKAIPVLLQIRDGMNEVQKNTAVSPQILDEIKAVRKNTDAIPQVLEDLPGYASNFRQMQSDIRAIKERLGMS
jgi:acylphosphatase